MIRITPHSQPGSRRARCDLKIGVRVSPKKRHPRQPVFSFDEFLRMREFIRLQKARCRRKFRTGHLPADGGGCNPYVGIVAESLGLARLGIGHDIQMSILFAKPDGRIHGSAVLAEGCQADVALAGDFWGNRWRHTHIVNIGRAVRRRSCRLPSPRGHTISDRWHGPN